MRVEPASSGCITRGLPLDSFQVDEEGGRGDSEADFFTVLVRTAWG